MCVQGLLSRVGLTVNTTEPGEATHRGSWPQHCDSEQKGGSASGRPGHGQELEAASTQGHSARCGQKGAEPSDQLEAAAWQSRRPGVEVTFPGHKASEKYQLEAKRHVVKADMEPRGRGQAGKGDRGRRHPKPSLRGSNTWKKHQPPWLSSREDVLCLPWTVGCSPGSPTLGRSLEREGDWVTEALAATAWGRAGTELGCDCLGPRGDRAGEAGGRPLPPGGG